jgi:hypothetical protein
VVLQWLTSLPQATLRTNATKGKGTTRSKTKAQEPVIFPRVRQSWLQRHSEKLHTTGNGSAESSLDKGRTLLATQQPAKRQAAPRCADLHAGRTSSTAYGSVYSALGISSQTWRRKPMRPDLQLFAIARYSGVHLTEHRNIRTFESTI